MFPLLTFRGIFADILQNIAGPKHPRGPHPRLDVCALHASSSAAQLFADGKYSWSHDWLWVEMKESSRRLARMKTTISYAYFTGNSQIQWSWIWKSGNDEVDKTFYRTCRWSRWVCLITESSVEGSWLRLLRSFSLFTSCGKSLAWLYWITQTNQAHGSQSVNVWP